MCFERVHSIFFMKMKTPGAIGISFPSKTKTPCPSSTNTILLLSTYAPKFPFPGTHAKESDFALSVFTSLAQDSSLRISDKIFMSSSVRIIHTASSLLSLVPE